MESIHTEYHAMAAHILCTGTTCQRTFINCPTRGDCEVECLDPLSCVESVINCPLYGDCLIICSNQQSCVDVTVDATLSSGNFKLICDNGSDHCRRIKVYGSTLYLNNQQQIQQQQPLHSPNPYSFNVTCNGNERSCMNSEIHCPLNGDCYIGCNGIQSCSYSYLIGPNYGEVDIGCNNDQSCFDSTINAAQSSALYISGCTEYKSCMDLSIYCPPNLNGVKNCHITGLSFVPTKQGKYAFLRDIIRFPQSISLNSHYLSDLNNIQFKVTIIWVWINLHQHQHQAHRHQLHHQWHLHQSQLYHQHPTQQLLLLYHLHHFQMMVWSFMLSMDLMISM